MMVPKLEYFRLSVVFCLLVEFDEVNVLSKELDLPRRHVEQTIELLDADNTIWFIARYRKEMTGGLDEEKVQCLSERLADVRAIHARRSDVLRLLEAQGNLTDELREELAKAESVQRIDDLYRPYRPKRQTRATVARAKGLAPLARAVLWFVVPKQWSSVASAGELASKSLPFFHEVETAEEALQGAQDLVAEWITDHPDIREEARRWLGRRGHLVVERVEDEEDAEPTAFDNYFGFQSPLSRLRPHQVLAIDRGEAAGILRVRVEAPDEEFISRMQSKAEAGDLVDEARIGSNGLFDTEEINSMPEPAPARLRSEMQELRDAAITDGYRRLLRPAVVREVRSALTTQAHDHAIDVFGQNLKPLLMQPPIAPAIVLGIDPGYRAGCKMAIVSPTGELLTTATIYPHPPQDRWEESVDRLSDLIQKFDVEVIAIGNGTASRETQKLAVAVIERLAREKPLQYAVVDEAGASVYSASTVAREEFPDVDVSVRGAVSIARRLQDPLAELVKIDPKSIGVGLYQHDVDQSRLEQSLTIVVESCVNNVGVDLNTASEQLLHRVSGLSARQAAAIVAHRREIGRFTRRRQLLDVTGIGPKTFQQCAGFLRIAGGKEPLDNTAIHPESYDVANRLLVHLSKDGKDPGMELPRVELEPLARQWEVGLPTLQHIAEALAQPGRDPRTELPPPVFRTDLLELEDVQPGMMFYGRVTNVVDFGAFVDIGLEKAGLVHVSQLSDQFVRDPFDVVSVGDIVQVWVLSVDAARGRIGLSMRAEGVSRI